MPCYRVFFLDCFIVVDFIMWLKGPTTTSWYQRKQIGIKAQQTGIRGTAAKYEVKQFDRRNDLNLWLVPVKAWLVQQGVSKVVAGVGMLHGSMEA